MKVLSKSILVIVCVLCLIATTAYGPSPAMAAKAEKKAPAPATAAASVETWSKPNAAFDASKMGDLVGWDPAKWVNPSGDTIKIAIVWPHSGPGALNGEMAWLCTTFAAYDINQRGGIMWTARRRR